MSSLPMISGGGELKRVGIGSSNSLYSRSFDVKSILPSVYDKLTINNFGLSSVTMAYTSGAAAVGNNILGSYNASTGVLSCNAMKNWGEISGSQRTYYANYTVVCWYVE